MTAVVRSVGARGFERKKLGDIATLNPENISKTDTIPLINYIDLGSVKEGVISNIQSFTFNDKPGRAQRKVKNNDILWGSVRPLSKSYAFIESPIENTIASTGFVVVRNNNESNNISKYIYYMLTSEECVQYLSNHSGGSSYPAFNSEVLFEYHIPRPPLPIQHEVLAILNEMEAELATLEQMAAKAEQRVKFILDGYLTPPPTQSTEVVEATIAENEVVSEPPKVVKKVPRIKKVSST
jgi:type I restriction enzyme S subunit